MASDSRRARGGGRSSPACEAFFCLISRIILRPGLSHRWVGSRALRPMLDRNVGRGFRRLITFENLATLVLFKGLFPLLA